MSYDNVLAVESRGSAGAPEEEITFAMSEAGERALKRHWISLIDPYEDDVYYLAVLEIYREMRSLALDCRK